MCVNCSGEHFAWAKECQRRVEESARCRAAYAGRPTRFVIGGTGGRGTQAPVDRRRPRKATAGTPSTAPPQSSSNLKRAATDTLPRPRGRPPAFAGTTAPGNRKITELFAPPTGQGQGPTTGDAGGASAAPTSQDTVLGDWAENPILELKNLTPQSGCNRILKVLRPVGILSPQPV